MVVENKISVFSFFSGCGILDLGFEKTGYDIVFVDEFSTAFLHAYEYSRKIMGIQPPKYGYSNIDVNEYLGKRKAELKEQIKKERNESRLVGFIGGPPCPDFSVGGKNRGRDGDNGKLSLSYVDLICNLEPDFFLFENVKGLWRTKRHRAFFEELKEKLSKAGYELTNRLTNALEFGVPQDRDRIILIGFKRSLLKQGNMNNFPWDRYVRYDLDKIKLLPWPTVNEFYEGSHSVCPEGIVEEVTCEYWFRKNDVINHPDAKRFFTPKAGLERMRTVQEGDTNKKSYKRIHRWRYSPTVCYGNNEVHLHPYYTRRLSVAEAMSLQSLPQDFCLPTDITLSSCFKTIGNGVPFLLAEGIAKTLREYIDENVKQKDKKHEV